jgi:hypothetical protein
MRQQVRLAALWGVLFTTAGAWLLIWFHAGMLSR